MHPLVQSAIQSAKAGENSKAIELLKQVLTANPADIDAWLVLAAVVDDPQRKRQCLNRVLAIDPAHPLAREELDQMDRAEAGEIEPAMTDPATDTPPFDRDAVPHTGYNSTPVAFESDLAEPGVPPAPVSTSGVSSPPGIHSSSKGKILVFQYPLIGRIMSYALIVVSFGIALFIATKSLVGATIFFAPGFVMLLAVLFSYPTVEVGDAGVRVFTFFADSSIRWDEIVRVKSGSKLELIRRRGSTLSVPKYMDGYLQIVEILQNRRPDLFHKEQPHSIQADGSSPSHPARSFKTPPGPGGSTRFKMSFIRKYGAYLYFIPVSILVVLLTVSEPRFWLSGLVSFAFCLAYMIRPLFRVSGLRLEQDKLIIETMLDEKSIDPNDIRQIKLEQVRGRYGYATNQVRMVLYSGRSYNLTGFSDGEEIIYGHVMNWWKGDS